VAQRLGFYGGQGESLMPPLHAEAAPSRCLSVGCVDGIYTVYLLLDIYGIYYRACQLTHCATSKCPFAFHRWSFYYWAGPLNHCATFKSALAFRYPPTQRATSKCPFPFAWRAHVTAFHSQPCSRAHCSTRCPPAAAQ
jgi:hypothetical protein